MMNRPDVAIVAALLSFAVVACREGPPQGTMTGRIEAEQAHLGSKVGGRVSAVRVDEGDSVTSGSVILELDRSELAAQRAQAAASVAQARARFDQALSGPRPEEIRRAEAAVAMRQAELDMMVAGARAEDVAEARAQVAAAESSLELARRERERATKLATQGALGEQALEVAQTTEATASAALDASRARLDRLVAGARAEEVRAAAARLADAEAERDRLRAGTRVEEVAAAGAAVAAAEADLRRIDAQLDETVVVAPGDVSIETLDLNVGDIVRPGATVAIVNYRVAPHVRCYLPETLLGRVEVGSRVRVTVDAFPGRTFEGTVTRIASREEFVPRNVQTADKRAELVFETRVEITGDAAGLRPGMYADVHFGSSAP